MALKGGGAVLGLLRFLVALSAARVAEILLGAFPGGIATRIDLFVLIAAFGSFRRSVMAGAFLGLAVGFFRAVTGGEPLGDLLLPAAAAAAFAAWAHRKLVGESTLGLFLILSGAVLVHDLVRFSGLVARDFGAFAALFALRSVPAGVLTGALGALGREMRVRSERKRRRRRREVPA